ncbi:MAG: TIM barrel protein [Clostridia bacterium]|nr:TIM barrel protein [Clostridia bacterium]
MKFVSGLVSISFRPITPAEIIDAVKDAGLNAVEWGSDVHVPAGNTSVAESIKEETEKAGLCIPEYGSYYKLGVQGGEQIENTVASARAMKVSVIRIWASDRSREKMSDEQYNATVADAQAICSRYPDMTFCLECHNNTVTEDYRDALKFLRDVNRPNLQMFWQPNQFRTHEYNIEALTALLPYIRSVHVFSWEQKERYPLDRHEARWMDYLSVLKRSSAEKIYLMLEFMHDNSLASLHETAETLNGWIARI